MVIINYPQVRSPETSAARSSVLKAINAWALIPENTVYSVFKSIHDLIIMYMCRISYQII